LCKKAILLVGGSGTSKTSSMNLYAVKLKKNGELYKSMNFSSATMPIGF